MKAICETMGVSRSRQYERRQEGVSARGRRYRRANDDRYLALIRQIIDLDDAERRQVAGPPRMRRSSARANGFFNYSAPSDNVSFNATFSGIRFDATQSAVTNSADNTVTGHQLSGQRCYRQRHDGH